MNIRSGIFLMVFSMLCFSISDGLIKSAAGKITEGPIIFYMGVGGAICFAIVSSLAGKNPFSHHFFDKPVMLRNFGEVLGVFGIITAIMMGTLSKTLAIHQMQPIVVTLGAVLFLGEVVGWRRWAAIGLAFACVFLIIRPSIDGMETAALFALIGVVGLSIRDLATKRISDKVSSLQLSAFAYFALIPLGVALTIYAGENFALPAQHWLRMAAVVLASMLAYIAITQAVRISDISVLAPFRYSRLIFIFIIGAVFFGEEPDWQTYVGAIGIVLSGLFMLTRERRG